MMECSLKQFPNLCLYLSSVSHDGKPHQAKERSEVTSMRIEEPCCGDIVDHKKASSCFLLLDVDVTVVYVLLFITVISCE